MFTSLVHFKKSWAIESESTLRMLRALTDASLGQSVGPDDRTLGRIAWHLTTTVREMMERTGLKLAGPGPEAPVPASAQAIVDAYEKAAGSLPEALGAWTDASLQIKDDMYGDQWKRGITLFALIAHQAHHRGQMTVLMRQAGLRVPAVYGPAREDWPSMGMAAPEI
jgi:uncharacterized damage-inducible protein DinB